MTGSQPGYDVLAEDYDRAFPQPFASALELLVVDVFADMVAQAGVAATVVDVGCGTGGVAAHLMTRGLRVHGVEPSTAMAAIASRRHPDLTVSAGDAALDGLELTDVRGIIARFSLIHVPPAEVQSILADWAMRLRPGAVMLIAVQACDIPGVHEFDHAVARAWRWNPESLAETVVAAGFAELWRTVSRPDDVHRFPEVHLLATATARGRTADGLIVGQ